MRSGRSPTSAASAGCGTARLARAREGEKAKGGAQQQPTQLDFLAIGNSWFDYPLDGQRSVVRRTPRLPLRLTQIGAPPPLVLNYALFGQATTAVLTYENQSRIIDAATDPSQWVNGAPDAILVSMGGDDLVGDQFAIYLDYQGAGLDRRGSRARSPRFNASYTRPLRPARRDPPGKPSSAIAMTTPCPNGVAPICAGPWLLPSLEFSGYDTAERERSSPP